MAYETEISNSAKVTNVLSDGISAALVQSVVVVPLIYAEDLPSGTAVKLFRKDGYLTAETISESAEYTHSASSELTQSTVTATAAKSGVVSKLTVEAQQFGNIDLAKIAREQGGAIARLLDDDVIALFDNHDNTVTATSILTADDVLQAAYTVRAALAGGIGERLVGVFDYKGIFELQKELMKSAGAALSNPQLITLLTGMPKPNGFAGNLPGVDLYQTNGLPSANSDDYACVFNPATCYAGIYSPSVNTRVTFVGATDGATSGAGFYDEVASWVFSNVVEWNDNAGCTVRSDT